MGERNAIGGFGFIILSLIGDFVYPLRYMLLVAVFLIICDLRFGVKAAKKRGEEVRFSRAGRRTINKMVDYLCWFFLACSIELSCRKFTTLGYAPYFALLVVYVFELNSCYKNYFEAKGIEVKLDILKWFKSKTGIDIEEKK